jgi:hypothetical protein
MRFAIKGIFQIETHFSAATRQTERFYEYRIINLDAETENETYNNALVIFEKDQWIATRPVSDIKYQKQSFLGISQVRDLQIMESYEVWYEYVDELPKQILDILRK